MGLKYGFLAILAVLVLSACTNSESLNTEFVSTIPSDAPLKEVHITAFNFGFEQEDIQINKGDRVRLIITSREGTHGLTSPELGLSVPPVSPGQEQTAEFLAKDAGTFEYFCNVPCGSGHSAMRSQLIINS